ncbi:hypothetical protein ACF1AY_26380 [Streptomyces sp. NPDC014776]
MATPALGDPAGPAGLGRTAGSAGLGRAVGRSRPSATAGSAG